MKNPRKFVPISADDLKTKMEETANNNPDYDKEYDGEGYCFLVSDVVDKDLKVRFDMENFYHEEDESWPELKGLLGINALDNGLTFCGCMAGGDWEAPLFFLIYWDGERLRAYIPTEGNVFNHTTMQAFGNDDEADTNDLMKRGLAKSEEECRYSEDLCPLDRDLLIKDIKARFEPRG